MIAVVFWGAGFVCGLGAASCSGKVVPQAPDPMILDLEARDGWTDQTVFLRNHGTVAGAPVNVEVTGYLPRRENYNGVIHLWPGDPVYVQQLVYSNNLRLLRWNQGELIVSMSGELMLAISRTTPLFEVENATSMKVLLAPPPTTSVLGPEVRVEVDPDDLELRAGGLGAVTYLRLSGNTIVGARIVCKSFVACGLNNVLLHELGHAVGLSHAGDEDSVMFPDGRYPEHFSHEEQVALRMMYRYRRPGNLPPDTDPGPAGMDAPPKESIVVVRG